jgi:hypothetical protein
MITFCRMYLGGERQCPCFLSLRHRPAGARSALRDSEAPLRRVMENWVLGLVGNCGIRAHIKECNPDLTPCHRTKEHLCAGNQAAACRLPPYRVVDCGQWGGEMDWTSEVGRATRSTVFSVGPCDVSARAERWNCLDWVLYTEKTDWHSSVQFVFLVARTWNSMRMFQHGSVLMNEQYCVTFFLQKNGYCTKQRTQLSAGYQLWYWSTCLSPI